MFHKKRKFVKKKNIVASIYGIQAYDLVTCEYFCIGFIDFMIKGERLSEYSNLFPPN